MLLPAQLAAYLLVFGVLWRLFAHHYRIGFFRALSWRWPLRWPIFLAGGVLLALAVQFSAHFLPAPPELPIDKMMRTASDAWLMTIFGVFIAPFAEEVLFRGLLFPALARRAGAIAFAGCDLRALRRHPCPATRGSLDTGHLHHVSWAPCSPLVRWRFRSLASSTLVHVGYNGALFVALFVQTRGFTNFSPH